jgi:hypothetical protein
MKKLLRKRNFSLKRSKKSVNTDSKPKKASFKQRITNATAHWNFKKLAVYFVSAGVLIAVITGWYWYQNLFMTPERRFYAALSNSMSTPSVVRTLAEGGSGNQVTQQFRFHFAPQRVIQNKVTFVERSATANTRVVTEGVIFPEEQFLRYTEFSTAASGQEETTIESLLGQWAVEEGVSGEDAALTYLSEQVSLVVFGNFNTAQRNEFLKTIKEQNIYRIDFANSVEQDVDGEKVIVYGGGVRLKEYATLLNNSFKAAGYGEFAPLDPENYREDAQVNAQFTVRKRDSALVGVNFGGRDERYGNYGVQVAVQRPEAIRSVSELQEEVQRLFEAAN